VRAAQGVTDRGRLFVSSFIFHSIGKEETEFPNALPAQEAKSSEERRRNCGTDAPIKREWEEGKKTPL
jgi:hypothetical protein